MEHSMQQPPPWYRQFWPWFIMALPASAVVAGIATVIIATQNRDSLVVDDYYKEGLSINQSIERDLLAEKLNASALLRVDPDNRQLTLQLSLDKPELPPTLTMRITHPTLSEQDRTLTLLHQGNGEYVTTLEQLPQGRWHVLIEPDGSHWRLTGRMNLAHRGQTQFTASH